MTDTINGTNGFDLLLGDGPILAETHDNVTLTTTLAMLGQVINADDGDDYVAGDNQVQIEGTNASDVTWNFDASAPDQIYGGAGNDVIFGDFDVTLVAGGASVVSVAIFNGGDVIFGGSGDDEIHADSNFSITYDGTSWVNVFMLGGTNYVEAGDGFDTVRGGMAGDLIGGGADNDILFGGEGDDIVAGEDGDDYISGGGDDDYIDGAAGDDEIYGGLGDDRIVFDVDDSEVRGGAGTDRLLEMDVGQVGVFNLNRHNFERAETYEEFSTPGIAPDEIVSTTMVYGASWDERARGDEYFDGSRSWRRYDPSAEVAQRTTYFDASDEVSSISVEYNDGSSVSRSFGGGYMVSRTFEDGADDFQWRSREWHLDSAGNVLSRDTVLDNDNTYTLIFDENGLVESRVVEDVSDSRVWDTRTTTWLNGVLQSDIFTPDA